MLRYQSRFYYLFLFTSCSDVTDIHNFLAQPVAHSRKTVHLEQVSMLFRQLSDFMQDLVEDR